MSIYLYISIYKLKKEQNILLGLISRQKLEKRTEKNGTFLLKNGNERYAQPFHGCGRYLFKTVCQRL